MLNLGCNNDSDIKIKEKLGISSNSKLTKNQYLLIIKKIQSRLSFIKEIPSAVNTKDEIINWLVENLPSLITFIPDL